MRAAKSDAMSSNRRSATSKPEPADYRFPWYVRLLFFLQRRRGDERGQPTVITLNARSKEWHTNMVLITIT